MQPEALSTSEITFIVTPVKWFISTWYKINFIRCCTRLGTKIGTNIEKVGVHLSPQCFFGSIQQIKFDKWYILISRCRVIIVQVAPLVICQQLICFWEELPNFYFLAIELIYVSLQNTLARLSFLLSGQDMLMNSKYQFRIWTIYGNNIMIKWVVMIMLSMVRQMLREN